MEMEHSHTNIVYFVWLLPLLDLLIWRSRESRLNENDNSVCKAFSAFLKIFRASKKLLSIDIAFNISL